MDAKAPTASRSVPDCLLKPQIRLYGGLDDEKYNDFQAQLDRALDGAGPIGFELTTTGGDADLARRIGLDFRIATEQFGRESFFIGKTIVYSAGITIMAAFERRRRFLTQDCVLLIHERRMNLSLNLSGALSDCLRQIEEVRHQLTSGLEVEERGFEALCERTDVSPEECRKKARTGWYISAGEALNCRLVEGLL